MKRVIPYVKEVINTTLIDEDIAVDATCGNGHDALFLSKLASHVYAFDIQLEAIQLSKELLKSNHQNNITFIHDSHANIQSYVSKPIKVAMFNLGYLPGSDHSIITKGSTTIKAIKQLLPLLKIGGLITLIIYVGHEGGLQESSLIYEFIQTLNSTEFNVVRYQYINKSKAPYAVIIERINDTR
ncbi:MAG: class I SAM-dependent methyltransferase [Candidatus Izimaplasma sp.]|nr:class I SAM-dependent methyltransferase [Candidatus Izimaplasma bacterium]